LEISEIERRSLIRFLNKLIQKINLKSKKRKSDFAQIICFSFYTDYKFKEGNIGKSSCFRSSIKDNMVSQSWFGWGNIVS
jgi:hypothetical protein